MNLAEKILARAAGRPEVSPGELIWAGVDLAMANELTGAIAISEFRRMGATRVFDRDKIVLVPDHYIPAKDIPAASQAKAFRDFAREQEITHYYEVGRMGIEHALLPEEGLVGPGQLIVGADSHTCTYGALGAFATGMGSTDVAAAMATGRVWLKVPETYRFLYHGRLPKWVGGKDLILFTIGQIGTDGATYRAMEFGGEVIGELSMDGRLTMCNMAVEAGGKTGLIVPDATTLAYVTGRFRGRLQVMTPDAGALPARTFEWNVSALQPQVAFPASPGNARPVGEASSVNIDQVVIGSCTNGRLEDLQAAAAILRGRPVHRDTRVIVIPATQRIYLDALRAGLIEVFIESGAAVSTPTCGPCAGCHMGVLAEGERALATTNRNFVGRMGHPTSEVYLAGPAVAAATAIKGRIAHPEEVCR